MTLEEIPIWDVPHDFAADIDGVFRRVFSYGLLLPEIEQLPTDAGQARLASRWGQADISGLPPADAEQRAKIEALGLPDDFDQIRFTSAGAERLRNAPMRVRTSLAAFSRALGEAADDAAHVPDGWEDDLRRFLNFVQRPDTFSWYAHRGPDGVAKVRGASYGDILQRISIEFDHLVSRQPLLARCRLCGRVFVPMRPGRPEQHCRANLWLLTDPPVQRERCVPLDETERLRMRRRLYARVQRARARHGQSEKHPEVKAAKQQLAAWLKANPSATAGRQPRPTPGYVPDTKEENDG